MSLLSRFRRGFFNDFYDDFFDTGFDKYFDDDEDYIILKKRDLKGNPSKRKQKFEIDIESSPKKKKEKHKETEKVENIPVKEEKEEQKTEEKEVNDQKIENEAQEVAIRDSQNFPSINVERSDQGMKIISQLPNGFTKIDVFEKRGHKYIIIKGEKIKSNEYQSFRNEFSLDENVNLEEIKSKLKNNLLTIHIPKKLNKKEKCSQIPIENE